MSRKHIPAELRRAVLVESGHRCAIPTCRQTQVEVHHIIPLEQCKSHEFLNLIALCPNCHTRSHAGEIDRKSLRIYKRRLADNIVGSVRNHGIISSGIVLLERSEGKIHELTVAGHITIEVGEWDCVIDSLILRIRDAGRYSTTWNGFIELPFADGFCFKPSGMSIVEILHCGGENFFRPVTTETRRDEEEQETRS